MLTNKQANLLNFIKNFMVKNSGVSPSFDEMRDALNLKSKSGVHKLIKELIERGVLEHIPNKARALRVISSDFCAEKENNIVVSNLIFANLNLRKEIPLYGKIAAGVPIFAVNDNPDTISVCGLPSYGDFYALTVSGDSMIEAGILDGDTVVIESTSDVRPTDIAVALVDDNEVTLKFIKKQGRTVALIPANKHYSVRVLEANRVKIQGKLVQLIRNF